MVAGGHTLQTLHMIQYGRPMGEDEGEMDGVTFGVCYRQSLATVHGVTGAFNE